MKDREQLENQGLDGRAIMCIYVNLEETGQEDKGWIRVMQDRGKRHVTHGSAVRSKRLTT
jgi:5-bromo-4-chloroindolyl phosphate hydrolysis protein